MPLRMMIRTAPIARTASRTTDARQRAAPPPIRPVAANTRGPPLARADASPDDPVPAAEPRV